MAALAEASAPGAEALKRVMRAIFRGDAAEVASLVEACPAAVALHDEAMNGCTTLHVAVGEDMAACVRVLVARGAPCDARDKEGRAPLHMVCPSTARDVVALVVAHGADANAVDAAGRTPLHVAVEAMAVDAIGALLEAGGDAARASSSGSTALGQATTGVDDEDADADSDDEDDDDDEAYNVNFKPLPARNWLVCDLLGATDALVGSAFWTAADLKTNHFEVEFADDTTNNTKNPRALGRRVSVQVTATVHDDEEYDDDEDDEEVVSDSVLAELVEESSDGAKWRAWLTDTPLTVYDRRPELMLLRGREVIIPTQKRTMTTMTTTTQGPAAANPDEEKNHSLDPIYEAVEHLSLDQHDDA